ncbi:T9SS type A sorting domain-containing protein [Bacteroidales bacterium OttesenSCG-928-C19]|nr:T9SS type A sorting domain-containing protein [Bacteroidales bacterium OttesenSCG-928-C19]
MKKIVILLFFISSFVSAQDTLTLMHYNVLNYGNTAAFCPESKYPLSKKSQYISTIIDFVKPDIVSFNEVSPELHYQDSLQNAVQTNNSEIAYRKAPVTNLAGANLVNTLFYNSRKIELHSAKVIRHSLRDINVYTMYYKDERMVDTVFFTCIVAHLKAGSSKNDEEIRASMAKAVVQWMEEREFEGNCFLMGDFNLYSSSEEAYQVLTSSGNSSSLFFDPIDSEGNWHDSPQYAAIHTQSTHLSNTGCFASGGLDDRFDFILFNESVSLGNANVKYINGSYTAVGNNGMSFNDSLHISSTSVVPEEVLSALYKNSDHLPVMLQVEIRNVQQQSISKAEKCLDFTITNPVTENLVINTKTSYKKELRLQIRNIVGNLLYERSLLEPETQISIPLSTLSSGVYILSLVNDDASEVYTRKFIKL